MHDDGWFRHDRAARRDPKILLMRAKYGPAGYGIYWMIVETLRETEEYKFPKKHLPALCLDFGYQEVDVFIEDCINTFELFNEDDEYIWSESLLRRMGKYEDLRVKRAESGKKGGLAKAERSKSVASAKQTPTDKIRLDKNRLDKIREEKKSVSVQVFDSDLEKSAWKAFEHGYANIMPDRDKQLDAILKLTKLAGDRGDPAIIIPAMMAKLKELKDGDEKFWKKQPFLPSTLVSLWARIWEEAKIEAEEVMESEEVEPVDF